MHGIQCGGSPPSPAGSREGAEAALRCPPGTLRVWSATQAAPCSPPATRAVSPQPSPEEPAPPLISQVEAAEGVRRF